ncbi:MAG: hypothetical protein ACI4VW_05255 [Acutalibacteraceae bacterium]
MDLHFKVTFSKKKFNVTPFYSMEDLSFGCEPILGDYAILIDSSSTSLDVSSIDNTICGICGYNPKENWIQSKLEFPQMQAVCGQLELVEREEFINGSAITYNRAWQTFFDSDSGMICIGDTNITSDIVLVEFCVNIFAALLNDELVSVWLKPVFK